MFSLPRNGRFPIALLASALFTLAQAPSYGQAADLDKLSEQQLDAALDAELGEDDLRQCGDDDLDAPTSKEDMLQFILCALRDEGDDEGEQVTTWADLEAEMEEAGTTIEEVVRRALEEADEIAVLHPQLHLALAGMAPQADWSLSLRSTALYLARQDGLISPGRVALQLVKVALRTTIQSKKSANATTGVGLAQARDQGKGPHLC
jgi:hypothetical protein